MVFSLSINPYIEKDELIRRLGGRKRRGFSRSLHIKLQNNKRIFYTLMNPCLFYIKKKIRVVDQGYVYLKGSPVLKSTKLARTLRDSNELICFITTVGGEIDSEINRMMGQGRLSGAYILDALGSVAVESVAEQFHQYIQTACREEGKAVTPRFSPGYCDWPITEQKKIFTLFDSNATGIELLDSCMMRPRKSISGVFGIYNDTQKAPYNPCLNCPKKNCDGRRV